MPHAAWKRPVLVVCAVPFTLGIPFLLWRLNEHPNIFVGWLLGAPLFTLSVLGLLVAFSGCSACVARVFGEF